MTSFIVYVITNYHSKKSIYHMDMISIYQKYLKLLQTAFDEDSYYILHKNSYKEMDDLQKFYCVHRQSNVVFSSVYFIKNTAEKISTLKKFYYLNKNKIDNINNVNNELTNNIERIYYDRKIISDDDMNKFIENISEMELFIDEIFCFIILKIICIKININI